MATQHYDNGPSIVEHAFHAAKIATEAQYGKINIERARKLLFIVMNDEQSPAFTTALSRAKTVAGVPESERSKYHSFAVRYFKHPNVKRKKKRVQKKESHIINWDGIFELCKKEQPALAAAAGEDRLDPAWEPPYEGPVW